MCVSRAQNCIFQVLYIQDKSPDEGATGLTSYDFNFQQGSCENQKFRINTI